MKTLIILILSINTALACQLSIPESYIPTFLNPPVSGHYEKCEDKPEEKCYCVDNVDPWTAELVTEFEQDELGINIEKKVLKESPEKKAAIKAKKLAEKVAENEKKERRKLAKEALKNMDIEGATTVAKLKAIVKLLLEAQE